MGSSLGRFSGKKVELLRELRKTERSKGELRVEQNPEKNKIMNNYAYGFTCINGKEKMNIISLHCNTCR